MNMRMSFGTEEPRTYAAMAQADKEVDSFDLDPRLRDLVRVRASQLNGCGYCFNLHTRDARKAGETEQRLYALSAWWETPFFTEEEQSALKLTEEVTNISHGGVSNETYDRALKCFGKQKLAQLIFLIIVINSWNRIAISMHMVADKD